MAENPFTVEAECLRIQTELGKALSAPHIGSSATKARLMAVVQATAKLPIHGAKIEMTIVDELLPDRQLEMPPEALAQMRLAAGFSELGWELQQAELVGDLQDLQVCVINPASGRRIRMIGDGHLHMSLEEPWSGVAPVLPDGWQIVEDIQTYHMYKALLTLGKWLGLQPREPLPLKVEAFFHPLCGKLCRSSLAQMRAAWAAITPEAL